MSFLERFPEKCSTFHSNIGHYKEKFECSFHSRKYWSRVTWIDCKYSKDVTIDVVEAIQLYLENDLQRVQDRCLVVIGVPKGHSELPS